MHSADDDPPRRRDPESTKRRALTLDRALHKLAGLVKRGEPPTELEQGLIDERLDIGGSIRR
jgi:hypothetical protein